MKKLELLSPAGNMEKLITALHFGADAVYMSGKSYGLRAFGENFDQAEMIDAINLVHEKGKKAYVTVNIFAHNYDFVHLTDYIKFLASINVDAVIVSDPGIIYLIKKVAPLLEIHLSTQANTTNKYSAAFWAEQGISRIVLARELSLKEISEIRDFIPNEVELEAFVHGAMCMAYSGRCLLSNFLSARPSNRGECSQSCRWEYALVEKKREEEFFQIEEDARMTYILNSKDLCMLPYIDKLVEAGIQSFKIEGRVKSPFYAGTITGAYRKAIDSYLANRKIPSDILEEPCKTSHRNFTTGFYFGKDDMQEYNMAKQFSDYEFSALVLDKVEDCALIEMRNRFKKGEELEVVSPNDYHGSIITIDKMLSEEGELIEDAYIVQQKIRLQTSIPLTKGDMLRKKLPKVK